MRNRAGMFQEYVNGAEYFLVEYPILVIFPGYPIQIGHGKVQLAYGI